jgi:hypothetical protein
MKAKFAAAIAEPVPAEPSKVVPNVVLRWSDCFRRCQQILGAMGRTCYSVEGPRKVPWEPGPYRVFDIPLQDGARVVEVRDFEKFARTLGAIQDCEKPFGIEWNTP